MEGKIELGQKEEDDWKTFKETVAFGLLGGPDVVLPRTKGHIDVVRIDYSGKPMADIRPFPLCPRTSSKAPLPEELPNVTSRVSPGTDVGCRANITGIKSLS